MRWMIEKYILRYAGDCEQHANDPVAQKRSSDFQSDMFGWKSELLSSALPWVSEDGGDSDRRDAQVPGSADIPVGIAENKADGTSALPEQ
ncbi:MAG: hypothetical protein PHO37_18845 [Kiritimatiellae bacterium]|nr:hypothetical protein [Kiritimatiellia bacterium]